MKEYALSEVFHHPEYEISNNDVIEPTIRPVEPNFKSVAAFATIPKPVKVKETDQSNNVIDYVPYAEKKRSKEIAGEKKKKLKKIRKSFFTPLTTIQCSFKKR